MVRICSNWYGTAEQSKLSLLIYYGLAADRQEYCFTKEFFFFFFLLLFLKFIFEPQQLFFQLRIKNSC